MNRSATAVYHRINKPQWSHAVILTVISLGNCNITMNITPAKLMILLFIASAGFLTAFCIVVYQQAKFQMTGSGASAIEANQHLWPGLKLPHSASDVTFVVDFGGCEAEFAISEADFLNLCDAKLWRPEPIKEPIQYFHPVLLSDDDRLVDIGYTVDIPDGFGVFDQKKSRFAY